NINNNKNNNNNNNNNNNKKEAIRQEIARLQSQLQLEEAQSINEPAQDNAYIPQPPNNPYPVGAARSLQKREGKTYGDGR
ncbi:MAG: hypothetical protein HRU26_14435, partial [Psychroserpens sp.]|nr:hypothetical protein [Psychroserpens sp.]